MASDLNIRFGNVLDTPTILPEQQGKVEVIVTNQGDQAATEPFDIKLYASTNPELDFDPDNGIPLNEREEGTLQDLEGTDELLGTLRINDDLNPNQPSTFTLDFASDEFRTASVVSPGAYFLVAEVDSSEGNNVAQGENSQFISTDGTDVVLDWNSTLLNAIQAEGERLRGTDINEVLPIASPPFAARNAAIVHRAIYGAVIEASGDESRQAAAAVEAAYQTLIELYPEQKAAFDNQRQRSLEEIPNGTAEDAGLAIGLNAANQILAERENDGSAQAQFPIPDGDEPGEWRPTPTRGETTPNEGEALLPGWGNVTPFDASSVEELLDLRPNSMVDDAILNRVLSGPPELDDFGYAPSVNFSRSKSQV